MLMSPCSEHNYAKEDVRLHFNVKVVVKFLLW